MLADCRVNVTMPAVDLDRAKKFYSESLGLKPGPGMPGGASFVAGEGTNIFLYERAATKADHTAAGFDVKDVKAEVEDLKSKGVTFETYPDMEGVTWDGDIASMGKLKVAWFKDTEGNILALNQLP